MKKTIYQTAEEYMKKLDQERELNESIFKDLLGVKDAINDKTFKTYLHRISATAVKLANKLDASSSNNTKVIVGLLLLAIAASLNDKQSANLVIQKAISLI